MLWVEYIFALFLHKNQKSYTPEIKTLVLPYNKEYLRLIK